MSMLFSPLQIGRLTLKNRIIMAPMCMYSSDDSGFVQTFHHHHYTTRSMGGVGTIVLEATAVEKRGRISANDLGIWSDSHIEGLKALVEDIKTYGASVGVQLAHAGRKCGVLDEKIIGPSAVAFDETYSVPAAMTEEDIIRVVEAFRQGARRALEAGFDFIEIHGAHGYLINTFLSPLTNHRVDLYGFQNEEGTQFLRQVLLAVKEVLPEGYPVWLRISAEEYHVAGNHPSSWKRKLDLIDPLLYSALHVSSGGVVPAQMSPHPGYQIPFAAQLKQHIENPVISGGLITDPESAAILVSSGQVDGVFLGRELLRNPYWPLQAAKQLRVDIDWPKPYERSK